MRAFDSSRNRAAYERRALGGSGWFLFSVRFSNVGESPARKNLRGPTWRTLGRALQNGFQKKKVVEFSCRLVLHTKVQSRQVSITQPLRSRLQMRKKNPKVSGPSTAISTPVRVARGYKTPRVGLRAFGFRWRTFPSWRRARTLDAHRVVEVLGKEKPRRFVVPLCLPGTMATSPADGEKPKLAVPSHFQCPVSMELMGDPVMVATGHTYDRQYIQRWLEAGNKTCPVTGVRLRHLELTPNFALRSAIQEWAKANGVTLKTKQFTSVTEKAVVNSASDVTEGGSASIPHCVLEGHEEIVWAVEATDGHLFSASADKTIRVWDTQTRRCVHVLEEHTRPVLSLAVSQRHGKLFSGSYDCSIRVWDLSTYRRARALHGHTDAVRSLAVSGDTLFSGSYDSTLRAYDINTLKPLKVLEGHTGPVRTLTVLGKHVFSGSYDKTVRVWDTETLEAVTTLEGHTDAVRALAASPVEDCKYVFSGSDDSTVRVWDAETFACVRVFEGHEDNVRVLTADSRYLYSGSWDKTIRVWDLDTLECAQVLEGHVEAVLALTVMRGHLISGSYDTTVRFWSTGSFACVGKFEGHDDAVRVLTSTGEDADTVYSGSYDGSIGFWSMPTASSGGASSSGAVADAMASLNVNDASN